MFLSIDNFINLSGTFQFWLVWSWTVHLQAIHYVPGQNKIHFRSKSNDPCQNYEGMFVAMIHAF